MNFSPYAFSLRQLQYIVAVADLLSFNRAADECHVSQPSLSLQIAELECVLGIKIFGRQIGVSDLPNSTNFIPLRCNLFQPHFCLSTGE
jgi:hypothetical protein